MHHMHVLLPVFCCFVKVGPSTHPPPPPPTNTNQYHFDELKKNYTCIILVDKYDVLSVACLASVLPM